MLKILKPIRLQLRKPLRSGRYPLKFFGGMTKSKNWIADKREFGRCDNSQVEFWYEEVSVPSTEDMHFIIADQLPPQISPQEKELILKGARMATEFIHGILGEPKPEI